MDHRRFPKHPKLRGEWAEWQFIARCFGQGFRVAKPLGDCCRYDVLVENPTGHYRVQIKSTTVRDGASYRCVYHSSAGFHSYSPADFDFLAAYVVPEDVWFIIPSSAITTSTVTLDPHRLNRRNKYNKYREAWRLLRKPGRLTIHAAAEPATVPLFQPIMNVIPSEGAPNGCASEPRDLHLLSTLAASFLMNVIPSEGAPRARVEESAFVLATDDRRLATVIM